MARLARIIIPGAPHQVTQRGNRRQPIFFSDAGRILHLDLLREDAIEARLRTGRPLAAEEWIARHETALDRKLSPAKRGRKPKKEGAR